MVSAAPTSDEQLMSRVQADDAEAFAELYDRLLPRALSVSRRVLVGNPDRATEAVQEGFAAMWRARDSYRPELGRVAAWALTLVRNRATDIHRREAPHDRRRSTSETALERFRAPDDLERDAVASDAARHLRVRLDALPVAQREVIALSFFGELTQAEIATRLTLPLGTVKGRMRLALHKLREELAPEAA